MKLLEHGWNDDRVFGHVTRPVVLQHRYQVRVKQTSAVEFPHAQPLKLFNKLFSKICVKLLSYCIVTNSFQPECSDFIPSFLSLKVSSLYMLQLWNMIFYNILEHSKNIRNTPEGPINGGILNHSRPIRLNTSRKPLSYSYLCTLLLKYISLDHTLSHSLSLVILSHPLSPLNLEILTI